MKSIHNAIWLDKVGRFERECYKDSDYVDEEKEYAFADYPDRSDMAMLNIEYEQGTLIFIKELKQTEKGNYTHIVECEIGHFAAIIIKEGEWYKDELWN